MSRNIITPHDIRLEESSAAALPRANLKPAVAMPGATPQTPAETADTYQTKLMKYIPGDVIALYVALTTIVKTSAQTQSADGAAWFIFMFCLIATPLYLWRCSKVSKLVQLLLSTGAFAVWVFALGGPFSGMAWYQQHQIYAALLLPIYTFLVPMIDP